MDPIAVNFRADFWRMCIQKTIINQMHEKKANITKLLYHVFSVRSLAFKLVFLSIFFE